MSRVLTLQSGQQCSTPNLKQKNYASVYSLKVNTVTFLSSTVTVIFLGKKYIRQRQHVDFKYLINSLVEYSHTKALYFSRNVVFKQNIEIIVCKIN